MTTEDKDLLLKDLCARLSSGLKIHHGRDKGHFGHDVKSVDANRGVVNDWMLIESCKPYLRPMSSMTKEEFDEYEKANDIDTADSHKAIEVNTKGGKYISSWYHGVDWLIANHFDYRGLIPMGLALEAPKGMYKTK